MEEGSLASWELRVEQMRVYYDVEEQPAPVVNIVAIARKVREKVFIGKEEIPT